MIVDRFWYANETLHVPTIWHYSAGIFSLVCLLFGVVSNGLVIFVFIRNGVLQRPRNYFLINLAITDMGLVLTNNSMHVISSFKTRWIFGQIGCDFYAVCGGVFGLTSIATMASISLTRLVAVNDPFSSLKLSSNFTLGCLACAWIYGTIWIMPPLFGWNRFILEGFGTSCTFDYVSKELRDRIFIVVLVTGGFFIPFSVILISYIFIVLKLSKRGRQFTSPSTDEQYSNQPGVTYYFNHLNLPNDGQIQRGTTTPISSNSDTYMRNIRRTEARATRTAVLICAVFCSAWGPYAFMTLFSIFGFDHLVNAYSTSILGILTKLAACVNPLIYALSLTGFREQICSYARCRFFCDQAHHEDLITYNSEFNRKSHANLVDNSRSRKSAQSEKMSRLII